MDSINRLGCLLRETRTERGMSLREFSDYLSISHAYLDKLEKGFDPRSGRPVTPTIETLKKIAQGLTMPMDDFLESCGYFGANTADAAAADAALELNALAEEFIAAVMDAERITKDGEPVSGTKDELLRLALQTLNSSVSILFKLG